MSPRQGRWILVVALLLFAIYAAYPPVRVAVKRELIVGREAQTLEEAREHGIRIGEAYVVDRETVFRRRLPLAMGERSEDVRVVERREDGSIVTERIEFVEGRIKRGLDVAGGTELLYELIPPDTRDVEVNVGQVIDILRRRIDPQNIKEYIIQPAGDNRILIQVPEATQAEVAALKERITRMGRLEFRIGLPRTQEYMSEYERAEQGIVEPGYEMMYIAGDPEAPFYLIRKGDPEITGERLQNVQVTRDERGQPAVGFQFTPEGGRQFARITSRNRGMLLGAVLDGVLQSAPVIQTTIRERGQITGRFTREEVDNLIAVLQAGSLPMDLDILQETTVGPQLGRDSIRSGLRAILIAGVLVLLFMGGYYLVCGCVADLALLFNLVLLAGVLGLLGAALTLPGLAGILLTVGMAVDANVLIFERMREELKAGKSAPVALRNGYDKAYSTIMDANITTLLTAAILYMIGTGPVRGFAITLSVGIVLSLFTSLYVTRLVFETLLAREWIREFKMAAFIGQPAFSYTAVRRVGYVVSLAVLVVGIGVFFGRGADMLDVDFTGGTLVHLNFSEPVPAETIRQTLIDGGYPAPQVQGVRGTGARGATQFRVRLPGVGAQRIRQQIIPPIAGALEREELGSQEDVALRRDGRSLRLALNREVDEITLRRALAGESGSPYELDHVAAVVAHDEPALDRVEIGIRDTGFRFVEEVMLDVLRFLDQEGARLVYVELDVSEVLADSDDEDGAGHYKVVTAERELNWLVVQRGLLDLNFEQLNVDPQPEPRSDTFIVRGPDEELEGLVSGSVRFLDVDVSDRTVLAGLREPVGRARLMLRAEQMDLQDRIVLVAHGLRSDVYVLELDDRGIRGDIEALFAGLGATEALDVTPRMEPSTEPGRVRGILEFDVPVSGDIIAYRLRAAGLEPGQYLRSEPLPGTAVQHVELTLPQDRAGAMLDAAVASLSDVSPVSQTTNIGAVVAGEMQGRALLAILCASVIIVIYVGVRFHAVRFGVAAVIALLHDVAITAGIIALADLTGLFGDVKINLPTLAAFLTIIGYSLNDTIVVFDRIRENTIQRGRKKLSDEIIDLSINQTLSRTVLTSMTTLAVVVVLYLVGGIALQGLAFTLIVGVLVGTYSSVFIASPILLDWDAILHGAGMVLRVLLFPVRAPFLLAGKRKG